MEDENVTNLISNAHALDWLAANIPRFECPEAEVVETYYFRWWSFRKHLKQTTNGYVFTEFLIPMRHAGAHNTISCAAGHHLAEGRWLHEDRFVDGYTHFWLRGNGGKPQPHFHRYSSWFAAAIWERYLVNGDRAFVTNSLDDLVADFNVWETERRLPNGLYWQHDVRDGMEESISGSRTRKQPRPTINSYMFANARAIAQIGRLAGRERIAKDFEAKAAELRQLVQEKLWNPADAFFEVRTNSDTAVSTFAGVREAIGFIPWLFHLPEPGRGYEVAWAHLADPQGFRGAYGITTAERRHAGFRSHGCCGCEWDGAVWPFATTQTLGAFANALRDYAQPPRGATIRDYFDAFLAYTHMHRFEDKPYIGEYMDETTGSWLKGRQERSRYYNHSTYADLLITGVVGLRPRADDQLEVHPLLPAMRWKWFCLDNLKYHGRLLTILWDEDGSRYQRGRGLQVLAGGTQVLHSTTLQRVIGKLP